MSDTLRLIVCGSAGDGKSTLIGSLLAESEQSATTDGSHGVFATPARRFIVADGRGHEQSMRGLAAGASTSDVAVLVVDALRGLQPQTLRDARIAAFLGIRHLVLAVDKMDLASFREEAFSAIVQEFQPLLRELSFDSFAAVPVSGVRGDNVTEHSSCMPWYMGPTLPRHLETVDIGPSNMSLPFRMPVQEVNRRQPGFRCCCGLVASGEVKVGDRVRLAPGGTETSVRSIVTGKEERPSASMGETITLCLEDEVDAVRGNVIAASHEPIEQSDQFEAKVLCLSEGFLVPGRSYLLDIHTCQVEASITEIKFRVDLKLGAHLAAKSLGLNDIAVVNIHTDRPVPFETYERCRSLGSFTLVDMQSNEAVGVGVIDFSLRRAANIHWQALDIDKAARAKQKLQHPICLWLTGLSGSGKSTIANLLEKWLFAAGNHTYVLDGDNVRHGLNKDLGFTETDRVENIRRVTEVAKILVDAGLVVIVSFISPYRAERERARSSFAPGEFLEIFVDAPLEECERRDPKGLYAKARRGDLWNFTGIDLPYEAPQMPDVHLNTFSANPEECIHRILEAMESNAPVMDRHIS